MVGDGDKQETGTHGTGGRAGYEAFIAPQAWQGSAEEALRQALVRLDAVPAPAGEMEVVLGPGWPGILLHEAIGHGLEGDFNRKKTSVFAGLMGERVASNGVTVVDDGTIEDRRGSLTVDDEGTPTTATTLIEDGRLVGFMQDRMNARLMNMAPTGNGRRQDFAHRPMPRMTNTYMLAGDTGRDEILASVKKGLYAVNFGGGQVDITSGKFVFSASEAYLIEDGKVGPAVKGATLIGNGAEALTRITMVGNDMELDPGIGTCGKDGQGVPVGVGQPTLKIGALTVGGTAA
jgi:TldD protein